MAHEVISKKNKNLTIIVARTEIVNWNVTSNFKILFLHSQEINNFFFYISMESVINYLKILFNAFIKN